MKVIVIGSGFGGLGVANRLAARGHEVEIFDKRDKLGGCAYQYPGECAPEFELHLIADDRLSGCCYRQPYGEQAARAGLTKYIQLPAMCIH